MPPRLFYWQINRKLSSQLHKVLLHESGEAHNVELGESTEKMSMLIKILGRELMCASRPVSPCSILISPSLGRLPARALFGGDGADDEPAARKRLSSTSLKQPPCGKQELLVRTYDSIEGLRLEPLIPLITVTVFSLGRPVT